MLSDSFLNVLHKVFPGFAGIVPLQDDTGIYLPGRIRIGYPDWPNTAVPPN